VLKGAKMAKLSANGQELLRVERVTDKPASELIIWERDTLSYRSTGMVLRKLDVRFRPDEYNPSGRFHSYGWKRWKRVKLSALGGPVGVAERIAEKVRNRPEAGWKVIADNTRTYRIDSEFEMPRPNL
jgi:hypothetical protein